VEDLVPGSPDEARGPKQLEEVDEGDDSDSESGKDDIEAKSGENKNDEDGAEKKEKLGRTPRLLVIEDLEEEGSADEEELDDLVLVIEDLGDEGIGDDEELDDILEEILTEFTEEESSTGEVSKSEPSSDSIEEAAEEIGDPLREVVSTKTKPGEEREKTSSDSKDSESENSVEVEGTEKNKSKEEEDITLKGINTILVVTTNTDKIDPDVELPEKIPEAKVNSKENLLDAEKNSN